MCVLYFEVESLYLKGGEEKEKGLKFLSLFLHQITFKHSGVRERYMDFIFRLFSNPFLLGSELYASLFTPRSILHFL